LDRLERVEVKSRAQWRKWLEAHCESKESIWLVTYKKAAGQWHLPYGEVVEEALCFGWIDSLTRKLDERRTMLLLSPRRAKSAWSKLNKERVARLIESGLMMAAGREKIERAKRDGSWDALSDSDALRIPGYLAEALAGVPGARERFDGFSESMRRRMLAYLLSAKTEGTRARRTSELLARCVES
jgi:uncharacterized protein YdeI (YjbR/CyaY-like superfamily)